MRRIKRAHRCVSVLMALLLVLISVPAKSVFAAMVGTQALLMNPDTQNARNHIRAFLERREVQSVLTARGIDPDEAQLRVDSLSDAEVRQIADQIHQLPAGGDFGSTLVYIAIIVLLVLLTMELLGYTDFI